MDSTRTSVAGIALGSEQVAEQLRTELMNTERLLIEEVSEADGTVLQEALHLIRAGGKRFRPMFTLLAAQFGPKPTCSEVHAVAVAVELTHLATLYHDDVMDEASTRRGAPSANAKYGNPIAILAGDFLFARASVVGARLGPHTVSVLARTFGELVTGQMRETKGAGDGDPVSHYLTTIWGKTASLIATAGYLGGLHAGLDEEDAQRLYRVGSAVGMAFQISDDIIDISSASNQSGKTPGTDLREGVHTLPVLMALQEDGHQVSRLREILVGPVTDDALLAEALELLAASTGITRARESVAEYANAAREGLAEFPDSAAKSALEALIRFTAERVG